MRLPMLITACSAEVERSNSASSPIREVRSSLRSSAWSSELTLAHWLTVGSRSSMASPARSFSIASGSCSSASRATAASWWESWSCQTSAWSASWAS